MSGYAVAQLDEIDEISTGDAQPDGVKAAPSA
jgi:hypothetical protein